jgi:hypothetical protein
VGNPGVTGERVGYSFTDQWAPRLGVTVDPLGRGKTKVYYNFGRFHEYIPLDLAERSLTHETSFIGARYAPQFTVVNGERRVVLNQFGTVTPVISAANLLNRVPGGTGTGIGLSAQDAENPILPGTKLGYTNEHLFGFEHQFPRNVVFSARYQDRRIKRIVEDFAVVSPEQFNAGLFGQVYFIGNVNARTDVAVNPIAFKYTPGGPLPAQCLDSHGDAPYDQGDGVCYGIKGANGGEPGSFGSDGVPDGFVDPIRIYKAFTLEVNKRFSNNWQPSTHTRPT